MAVETRQFLDTNVVIRYFLDDVPDQAARAASVIESQHKLVLSVIVLAEIGSVLVKRYGLERSRVADSLISLIDRDNISVQELPNYLAVEALRLCRTSGRVSFADALLWATARSCGGSVWTFDERFPSDQIEVMTP
jgi:predicted nucleic acid-binding protein